MISQKITQKPIPLFDSSKPWLTNMHTHSHYCDGKKSPRNYAVKAISKGLQTLGYSGHAPVPIPPGAEDMNVKWCMPFNDLHHYIDAVKEIKSEFNSQLDVRLGLEIDYIPHIMGPGHPMFKILNLDYTIGSVHVAGKFKSGKMWTVDCNPEKFQNGLEKLFNGSVEKAGQEYYRRIREMVETRPPDIIGHFDLFKKNNKDLQFLDESAKWYRDAVFETLDVVAASRCIIEVNTGGMARGFMDEPYPSLFILERCCELQIPVMINSDAHRPKMLTAHFDQAVEILKKAGY